MKIKKSSVKKLCIISILSALSAIVMLYEIPLWFAPGFYKIDFSEIFVLIGGFSMGPVAAIIIEFMKILLNTVFTSTETAFVGELANFIVGCAFVLPASIIYKYQKSKIGALVGLILGTLTLTVCGCFVNYYILLPMYSKLYNVPLDGFVSQGTEKNGNINSLFTLVIYATLPFNLLKGTVDSIITFIIYKKISPILHKQLDI